MKFCSGNMEVDTHGAHTAKKTRFLTPDHGFYLSGSARWKGQRYQTMKEHWDFPETEMFHNGSRHCTSGILLQISSLQSSNHKSHIIFCSQLFLKTPRTWQAFFSFITGHRVITFPLNLSVLLLPTYCYTNIAVPIWRYKQLKVVRFWVSRLDNQRVQSRK